MHPFEQQVRERAYFIWEGEGRVYGHATDHWLRAERELVADRPVQVRPVAAEISLAPSPARALKPKTGTRSAAAKAVETAKPAKAPATKAAKAPGKETASTKPASTKTAATKTASAKAAAPRTAAPKTTAPKTTTSKVAAARSKAFSAETSVVMH